MLMLTRKIGQSIVIANTILVKVLKVNGCQVSLGVDAPSEIPVHREEIHKKINEENNQNQEGVQQCHIN